MKLRTAHLNHSASQLCRASVRAYVGTKPNFMTGYWPIAFTGTTSSQRGRPRT